MGNFRGHAFPGTLMIFLALFYFLRSLNVSFLRPLRTKQFWITFEALGFAFYGALGVVLETLDALIPNVNFSESHLDHIHITSVVCLSGLITLLHLYKVLDGAGWGLFLPSGLIFIAVMFTAHPQPTDVGTFAHDFTAVLFFLTAASRAGEYLVGLHANKSHHLKTRAAVAAWRRSGRSLSRSFYLLDLPKRLLGWMCCCLPSSWCYDARHGRDEKVEKDEVLVGLHPAYTNPKVYQTVLPMLTAYTLFLNGVWWWEMAVTFYITKDIPDAALNGHMAKHYAYSHMIYPHVLWVTSFFVIVAFGLKWLDSRVCCGTPTSFATEEEEDGDLNMAPLGRRQDDEEGDEVTVSFRQEA